MLNKASILRKTLAAGMLFVSCIAYGQSGNIAINSSGVSPNSSAILDLSANTTGGFLLPSLSTLQIGALGSLANGLLIYDNSSTCYEQYYSSCSCWQVIFCPCNNSPATPGGITGDTVPCAEGVPGGGGNFSSTSPYAVTPVNDATSYSWILTPNSGGTLGDGTNHCGGDIWSGFVGNGGRTISGALLTQDITWWQGCTYTLSVSSVNACGTSTSAYSMRIRVNSGNAPVAPTVAGPTSMCTNSTGNIFTASAATATSYTWTLTGAGTITSGGGTGTITVTGPAAAGTGTLSVTATGPCGTSSASTYTVSVVGPPSPPTISGPTSILASSTTNTYTATSAGATSFTWTVPASVGTIASGQGTATITVTGAASGGSGNITATATGSCGTSAASANYGVTVIGCGTITADGTGTSGDLGGSTYSSNSISITTTVANDLVIVSCHGEYGYFNGAVSVVPPTGSVPTVTQYASVLDGSSDPYANIAIYYFVAATPGSYTINITEGNNWYQYYYDNFAVALTGFCGVPSGANIHNPSAIYYDSYNNCVTNLSASLTEQTNSYAIGMVSSFWCYDVAGSYPSGPTWTNLTSIASGVDKNDVFGFAGQAIGAGATPSIKAAQGGDEEYGVIYLLDIY